VKPLYGHQEGAEIGYDPRKPGRPSHCRHTLRIAKPRLAVHPGNETAGTHSRPMLAEYLAFVSAVRKPRLVRGDVSFGDESVIGDCEEADVRYLFKTKRGKARETYRAISAFLSKVASASQLSLEERRQRIIAHAFRKYGTVRRLFPPDIGGQMTMPLA